MKRFFIKQTLGKELNAGPKAKLDTYKTLEKMGYEPILYVSNATFRLVRYLQGAIIIFKVIKLKNSIVFMENPIKNWRFLSVANKILNLRNNHLILLIHDIESERYSFPKHIEYSFINTFNSIIVHNEFMKEFLAKRIDKKIKIYALGIFDYLVDSDFKHISEKNHNIYFDKDKWEIVFCGNLGRDKSSFLYSLNNVKPKNWILNLYGLGIEDTSKIPFIKYWGSFSPDKPIINENSQFGLIWDGSSTETCDGIMGEYMKINNPHKLSLYITLNLPIIVWKNAAVSKFVEDNGLGFSISNLADISDKLSTLTYKDYQTFLKNIENFNKKVTSGEYLTSSLEKICAHL